MMKLIIILMVMVVFADVLSAVSYWVDDFNDCPTTYMSLTCTGTKLACGYSSTLYCAEPADITAPTGTASSVADYDVGSFNGGYLIDCYAVDSAAPYCNNNGVFWCDRNSTCYTTKHRSTTCTADVFGASTCGACRTSWDDCSGDDDCETNLGVSSCAVGSNNNVPSCGNCYCDSGAFDCDGSGNGTGNGCEILNGAACTIGGLSGVYSGCSGAVGNCVVPTSNFVTGTQANYSTTNFLLWGKNFGLGWLMNLTNSTNSSMGVNQNGCVVFPDATSQCTAATGSLSYAQIAANIGNYSADKPLIYTNVTALQTSNTSIWSWLGNLYSNITSLQTSNTSIWTRFTNVYNNMTSIGNYSADKVGLYTNITSIRNNLSTVGNWTYDKPYYYGNLSTIGNYSQDKAAIYTNITNIRSNLSTIGNWTLDKPSYVPYTGASGAVNLGANNITVQNLSITGSPGYISGNATCFKINFNSTVWIGVGSGC